MIIFGLSFIPFLIALGLKENPQWVSGRTNKGKLITPVVPTERNDLSGFDRFSVENIKELKGHWLLVNLIPEQGCNETCLEAIHKSKQIRLMLNKELTRTRRVVLLFNDVPVESASKWWENDKTLLRLKPNQTIINKISAIRQGGKIPDGMLLLMDPLGNIMMQYEPGFDPYDVKSDLMRLLRISQIG